MNLDLCNHGAEKRAQMLDIEILPASDKPRSLVKKRLMANGVGPTILDCVQHGDRISEPCADPASDQSFDVSGRNALTPRRRLIVSGQQRLRDVISIPDTLFYRMTRSHRFALRIIDETGEQA